MGREPGARRSVLGNESSIPLGSQPTPGGTEEGNRRYANLLLAGDGLRRWGRVLQGIGWLLMVGGPVTLVYGIWEEEQSATAIGVLGLLWGAVTYAVGLFSAAAGEAGKALADIAINTGSEGRRR